MSVGRRNPIRWHGDPPADSFTQLPNDLVRDMALTANAFRIAVFIRSHADGYEVSVKSLSDSLGWSRVTVRKAMADLVDSRWLAVCRYQTADGTRAYEEYHVNASRKFTEEEAARYGETVTLPAKEGGHEMDTPLVTKWTPSWSESDHPPGQEMTTPPGQKVTTKEHQGEHQLEDQSEQQTEHQATEPICDAEGCTQPATPTGRRCVIHYNAFADAQGRGEDETPTSKRPRATEGPLDWKHLAQTLLSQPVDSPGW